jgi:2-desacetyl-2-hydroxyethyl bacteriochlorophyllide A dehydrogenase
MSHLMRAAVLEKPGEIQMAERPWPGKPQADEVSVRVRRVGVCGTDYHAFRGNQPFFRYPRVLGHELSVEVLSAGEDGTGLKEGDRCAIEPYLNCGHCSACLRGKTNCCANLQVLGVHIDGGMCEHINVPRAKLHRSRLLNLDQLALVETLGIGAHAVERAALKPGEQVLIIGMGPIGLSVAEFARQSSAEVIAADVSPERLDFSHDIVQLSRTLDARNELTPQLTQLLDGDLPTVVFDCTGSPESMQRSFSYVASGGKLVFVGLFRGTVTFDDPEFHRREMTLLSSRNSTAEDFRRVIGLMEAGKLDVSRWITHRVSSHEFIETFPRWIEMGAGVIKGVVEW